ncbi:hypothetical protein ACFVT6_09695 [Streptomyces sp. NPDC058049]|uniref:hypothetical protein n=1 Tax=Streptomyces sp. NPDC058049 TaxID=3346314 RepID=UPI0036E15E65
MRITRWLLSPIPTFKLWLTAAGPTAAGLIAAGPSPVLLPSRPEPELTALLVAPELPTARLHPVGPRAGRDGRAAPRAVGDPSGSGGRRGTGLRGGRELGWNRAGGMAKG